MVCGQDVKDPVAQGVEMNLLGNSCAALSSINKNSDVGGVIQIFQGLV